jgi:ubiquinone/menaquinone biosynthesis C-methylase UbiE
MTIAEATAVGQADGTAMPDQLPTYAPMLAAFHRAHAAELRAMIAELPLRPGDRVLDMACGDGTYSVWLAERVAPYGAVTSVDISPAYLEQARTRADSSPHAAHMSFQIGDIASLPFDDNSFDLVWCAQSMYTLPDPLSALRELRRVARVGGTVAVFENDTLHQLVLPWPPALELAVRQAQLRALAARAPATAKFFIGRELCGNFAEADLDHCVVMPYTSVRHAPLSADDRSYLAWYFDDLAARARPYLDPETRAWFDHLLDSKSEAYLLDRRDFYVIYIGMVARAVKCGG